MKSNYKHICIDCYVTQNKISTLENKVKILTDALVEIRKKCQPLADVSKVEIRTIINHALVENSKGD